jgi:hypothetical protein
MVMVIDGALTLELVNDRVLKVVAGRWLEKARSVRSRTQGFVEEWVKSSSRKDLHEPI